MIFNRKPFFLSLLILVAVSTLQSCIPENKFLFVFNRTSVKNPPADRTPFVFANEIHVAPGVIAKDEQKRLETELDNYWDDTVKARTIQQFGVFYRIKKAQRFDTIGLSRSRVFMNSFLQSQGYYNAVLRDTFRIDTFRAGRPKEQLRVTTVMNIDPGKRLRLDSIAHQLVDTLHAPQDSMLQQLALQVKADALLKPGDPYSKQIIAAELDRLIAWFRQNGYYRLNRENLAALVDTTDQLVDSLILDPFELARITSAAAERRRMNPTADVTVMQATQAKEIAYDTAVIKQYRIGNIYYYPETNPTSIPDSLLRYGTFNLRQNRTGSLAMKFPGANPLFRMRPLIRHTYLTKGGLYNEKLFYKTINAFGQMGPWQQVDVRDSIRNDSIDFHIFLSPNRRYNIKTDFELTRSSGDFASSNNLFGIGGNLSYLDRNFLHRANQFTPFVRAGIELNLNRRDQLLQTFQFGTGLSWIIPHLEFPKVWAFFGIHEKNLDATRTVVNVNATYTDRRDFFRVRSFNTNAAFEFRKDNSGYSIRFPNIELYSLDTLDLLRVAFDQNPFLRTAFNTGSVFSVIGTHTKTVSSRKNRALSHYRRIGLEYAGFGIPALAPKLKDNVYHYLKGELEYIAKWQFPKNAFVVRGFFGMGYNLVNDATIGKSLPFFKQYVAGGPNSMRAWGLRQLGLGSSLKSETAPDFKDRFGDLQLEGNIEYRFQLADVGGAIFSSAVFTDFGNLWNVKKDALNPGAEFRFDKLYDDLAVGLGVGLLRLNVANFILRVDFALKVKDPTRQGNSGWLDFGKFSWKNEYGNSNYAFQLGIGLPF